MNNLQSIHDVMHLLNLLDEEEKKAFFDRMKDLRPVIDDVWFKNENAISYWLLFINGIDSQKEAMISKELLFWREFLVQDDAQLRCLQTSDRRMSKFCTKYFNISNPPVLIFSKDPFFNSFIKIESELLIGLISEENNLRNFVNKIHAEILVGKSLPDIKQSLYTEKFWKGLRFLYKEAKSFVSISFNIEADVTKK